MFASMQPGVLYPLHLLWILMPVGVLRANYLSQGVVVPPGTHIIEFHFRPGAFTYGALISGFGILAAALLMIAPRWVSRRQKLTEMP